MRRDRDLESELEELGSRIEYPPTPDLAGAVLRRLEEGDRTPRRRGFGLPDLSARWAAAAALLLFLAVPLLSPATRETFSGWFVAAEPPAADGGKPQDAAVEPGDAAPGPSREDGVALVYSSRPGLPSLGGTGIGLVLTEVPGDLESAYLETRSATGFEEVNVDGGRGFWYPEGHHPAPPVVGRSWHPRADVLLWEREGRALRMEANLPTAEAVRIAGSTRYEMRIGGERRGGGAAPAAEEFAAGEASVPGDWAAQGDFDRKIVKTAELGIRAEDVRESA